MPDLIDGAPRPRRPVGAFEIEDDWIDVGQREQLAAAREEARVTEPTSTSLRDVPVLVTGADGFIGSHLVERLVAEGARVRAFCIYNSRGSAGWLDEVPAATRGALDLRLGDIRDARFVERAVAGVEVVFHLAALIAIPYSYVAPESFIDTNVSGTLNVLEARARPASGASSRRRRARSTARRATLPIRETHPLQAQSPYAASKFAADQLALSYQRSFGVPVVVLRPFNTYGPRQSARAVLPTMLGQLLAGKHEIKLGRLDPRRDLTFVTDTVDGFVRAAQAQGIDGRTIQLGTGRTSPSGTCSRWRAGCSASTPCRSRTRLGCDPMPARCWSSNRIRLRGSCSAGADHGARGRASGHDQLASDAAPLGEVERVQL